MRNMSAWIICPTCSGDGSHSRDLGSFTVDEFNEAFDDEEQEMYFSGAYDRCCETCGGSGKIREDDEDADYRAERRRMYEKGVNDAGERLW